MHRLSPVALVFCLLWSVACGAHTHLVASSPADQTALTTAPKEAVLTFAEAVVMTAANLVSADGGLVALAPLPDGSLKEVHLPLPVLAAGRYRLKWRAASSDGHVMSGEIHFDVKGSTSR